MDHESRHVDQSVQSNDQANHRTDLAGQTQDHTIVNEIITKRTRLALPAWTKGNIDFIDDAIKCLRLTDTFTWQSLKKGEQRFNPFFDHFDEQTRKTINRLARLHDVSRSKIVTTALELHRDAPRVSTKPSGYRTQK